MAVENAGGGVALICHVRAVNTQEFWRMMCDPGAVRTGLRSVAVGGNLYVTDRSPEETPGFMPSVIDGIQHDLTSIGLVSRFRAWIAAKRLINAIRQRGLR